MSSQSFSSVHSDTRSSGQASFIVSLALLMLAAGAMPVAAQQRVEITTKRVGRSEASDSVRKLQRSLDSLSHVYTDDEQLTLTQRRRLEGEIRTVVERLNDYSPRMSAGMLAPTPMGVRAAQADAEAMSRALMQEREYEAAMPRGWIGFVAQGPGLEPRVEGGQLIVRYFSYPRILSVDPSSPAQAAGIATDDTLLAYDGRDVRENDISLTRLLRPNARVRVRVLRDGRVHEIPVTVAVAPGSIARRRGVEVGERETWNVPEGPSFPRIAMVPQGSAAMRSAPRIVMSTQTPGAAAPAAPQAPTIFFGMTNAGVAGAQLSTITRDFSKAMGLAVMSGVMVMNAPLGSVAYESGLRDGDIITKVAGRTVRSVSEVRALVEIANGDGGRSVEMDVLRQKKAQRIVLKW
jgi:C-terminal processing protease CtpA/Prc